MNLVRLLVFCFLFTACKENILHDLKESESNILLTKLDNIDIKAKKRQQADGNWAVAVNKKETFRALKYLHRIRALKKLDKPRTKESKFFSSSLSEKTLIEDKLSEELEYTLKALEQVIETRVHLNFPKSGGLLEKEVDTSIASASILLLTMGELNVSIENIKDLISGASGILKDNISVVINKSKSDISLESFKKPKEKTYLGLYLNDLIKSILAFFVIVIGSTYFFIRKVKEAKFNRLQAMLTNNK